MNKLVNDLSTLTTISKNALNSLTEKAQGCICHCVYESLLEENPLTEVDIGIGTLYIKCEEDEIKYKFIPAKKLEENVAQTVRTKVSPITLQVETALKERIESTYKQLV